jgi:succinate-semialdehyde dehydrogenase/glutarate-semialdehyde dehydrogenase
MSPTRVAGSQRRRFDTGRLPEDHLQGLAFVNDNVCSDLRMPFGGVEHSGFGRECAGYGMREFVNVKSMLVKQ